MQLENKISNYNKAENEAQSHNTSSAETERKQGQRVLYVKKLKEVKKHENKNNERTNDIAAFHKRSI